MPANALFFFFSIVARRSHSHSREKIAFQHSRLLRRRRRAFPLCCSRLWSNATFVMGPIRGRAHSKWCCKLISDCRRRSLCSNGRFLASRSRRPADIQNRPSKNALKLNRCLHLWRRATRVDGLFVFISLECDEQQNLSSLSRLIDYGNQNEQEARWARLIRRILSGGGQL